ncbi:helix-turn-helix transcriptional regulator [Stenotrophomonas mori]|uniref:YafY family transcriptional regulator n=1 Tax=Stenotrophomonas mori TaxID=2871096 RepID=A0ABT0SCZ7_9GAMM|nr:YafY family protein [Stenotrophomonas mori]MCL7713198.1 YafY family transcriptional regulator [Stenotrophomonas mori]
MSGRATRLLHLLDALQRRRLPVRGAQLAEDLGVSLRTLYRDIDALRSQGADIAGDPGIGYQLRGGFLLPPMMFSAEELEAIVLGVRWVASHADPDLARAAGAALDRVTGVLPGQLRLQVETSGLYAPQWSPTAPEPWLPALRRAIRAGNAVRIDYRDAEGRASERVIWPFAMAFLAEVRLLAAWCEMRGDFRHFRADRVVGLHDTGRRYPDQRHRLLKRWHAQRGYRQDG